MKKFFFEIPVISLEHSPDTVEQAFGKGAGYNPDFPEEVHAWETISSLFKDAICFALERQMDFLANTKRVEDFNESEKRYWDYLKRKVTVYNKLQEMVKCVRSEPLKPGEDVANMEI